jgi:Transposase
MWKPFLNLIALRARNALNILDRFHIAQKLSDAIDDVRAAETKELMREGKEVVDSPASFDGRYFGPLSKTTIQSVIVPVITWK